MPTTTRAAILPDITFSFGVTVMAREDWWS
jgi:hypothetical protein